MMVRFEQDECIIIAMFQGESRQHTIDKIRESTSFIKNEPEMCLLVESTLEKLECLSDQEFQKLDLQDDWEEQLEDGE